jgi:hypothetical protein
VPIYRLLQNSAFQPEMIEVMTGAFEDACDKLGLANRTDALRDLVARKIIEVAQTGERDRGRIAARTIEAIQR